MKSRTVIILWIIAVLLGIAAYIVKFHGGEDHSTRTILAPGQKLIESLPIREITRVTLSQGKETTTLNRTEKNGEPAWHVAERGDYVINYELLRNLLGALGEIEVTQGYPATSEHYGRFGLATQSDQAGEEALRITIAGKEGATVSEIFFGKFSGTSQTGGRFLRLAGDDSGVYAVGETFPGVTASPKDWLSKDFIGIELITNISISAPSDPNFKTWTVVKHPKTDGNYNPNGQFLLQGMTDDEVMQLTSTNPLRNLFSYSAFKDVLSEKEAAESAHPDAKLKRQAVIATNDGFTYILNFWPQNPEPKDPNADPRLPAVQPNYLLTIEVSADIPTTRKPATDETPEVTKTNDAAFAQILKIQQEKLAAAQALQGRIYQISQSTISPLQKLRSDFVKTKNKPSAATPPVQVPGAAGQTQPGSALQALPQRP